MHKVVRLFRGAKFTTMVRDRNRQNQCKVTIVKWTQIQKIEGVVKIEKGYCLARYATTVAILLSQCVHSCFNGKLSSKDYCFTEDSRWIRVSFKQEFRLWSQAKFCVRYLNFCYEKFYTTKRCALLQNPTLMPQRQLVVRFDSEEKRNQIISI